MVCKRHTYCVTSDKGLVEIYLFGGYVEKNEANLYQEVGCVYKTTPLP